MEEASVAHRTPEIPTSAQQDPHICQTPLPAARPSLPNSNKRKADHIDTQDANFCKLTGLVKDLRPYFIEVLHTPDFRKSKAADEIRKKMKLVMDVYKQMTVETPKIETSKKPIEENLGNCQQSLAVENIDDQRFTDKHVDIKKAETKQSLPVDAQRVPNKTNEVKQVEKKDGPKLVSKHIEELLGKTRVFQKCSEPGTLPGSYIIGGSNCGWNFVMYPSDKAVYYGTSKEAYRAKQQKMRASQVNSE